MSGAWAGVLGNLQVILVSVLFLTLLWMVRCWCCSHHVPAHCSSLRAKGGMRVWGGKHAVTGCVMGGV